MSGPRNPPDFAEHELRILCLLCQDIAARERLIPLLRPYRWRDLIHRTIFEAVAASPQLSSEQLRVQLPARLTRAGFPEFPWNDLFGTQNLSGEEAETLARILAGASG